MVLWEGFYKSLSTVDGKCFSGTSARPRFSTMYHVSFPLSHWGPPGEPSPSMAEYRPNPDKMVNLTGCSWVKRESTSYMG